MSHGIYSGILWLAFYLVIHYQGKECVLAIKQLSVVSSVEITVAYCRSKVTVQSKEHDIK
jgi:uncharacterized membrane protein